MDYDDRPTAMLSKLYVLLYQHGLSLSCDASVKCRGMYKFILFHHSNIYQNKKIKSKNWLNILIIFNVPSCRDRQNLSLEYPHGGNP